MHYVKAKGILSASGGMNLYRGCTHGCIYCDSRSRCYRMEHAFEDIEVKENALQLLEDALSRKRKKCMISTGAMTDPYMPLELELRHTRQALELIGRYGFGAALQTKSAHVLRDIDVLCRINENARCVVQMTLTTADDALCRMLEPHVSVTSERIDALARLHAAGIPTVVWLSPILPFINDTEENISALLRGCARAGVYGVICFGMGLTLREGNREYFYRQLDRLFPGMKERYARTYGSQYIVSSPNHAGLMALFHQTCARYGLVHDNDALFAYLHAFEEKPRHAQLSLFDHDTAHESNRIETAQISR
ncbi:MAG: radical SAM protein [Clostridia bacterium]|nr:radical SAM protein [Clostridia bacterium]